MPVCRFAAFLWNPTEFSVFMGHYKIGWESKEVDTQEKNVAVNSLRKWVYGFRKGAKSGPFFLHET